MAAITASMVAELRAKTDAPMMECKKALTEADGDMVKAEEILRVKLGNKATKAATRIAAEGIVSIYIADDAKTGAIIEVNSETDFVAKNDDIPNLIQAKWSHLTSGHGAWPYRDNQKNRRSNQSIIDIATALYFVAPIIKPC